MGRVKITSSDWSACRADRRLVFRCAINTEESNIRRIVSIVQKKKKILMKIRIRVFNSNVKSVLRRWCETWKLTNEITNKLRTFVYWILRRVIGIRWPKIISNTDLWETTGEKPIILKVRMRKWRRFGHAVRMGDTSPVKQALDWNSRGVKRRGQLTKTWKRTVLDEAGKCGKTWSQVKGLAGGGISWRRFGGRQDQLEMVWWAAGSAGDGSQMRSVPIEQRIQY
jgi:hypothetical protein